MGRHPGTWQTERPGLSQSGTRLPGRWLHQPSDETAHEVALLLQTPCPTRTRLGQGQYLNRDGANLSGKLEQALEDIISSEAIFDKICSILNENLSFTQLDVLAERALQQDIISKSEAELLTKAEHGRRWVISVDDFNPEQLTAVSSKS